MQNKISLLFLGTGTSTGIPTLCCRCDVCLSPDAKNNRLRASLLIESEGQRLLVDSSTDLRQQCLKYDIRAIDSVLYTHHHADHVHGIDELRCFNFFNNTTTPCYANKYTILQLQKNFSYIFNGVKPEGGGIPQLIMNEIKNEKFKACGLDILPIEILHGSLTITAYKFGQIAYVTDCNGFPEHSKENLKNLDLLILNALGFEPHPTHFCLDEALEQIEDLKPKRAILTHINHKFDHDTVNAMLPENVELAYDGMRLDF